MRVPAALRAANSHNFWFSFWGALHFEIAEPVLSNKRNNPTIKECQRWIDQIDRISVPVYNASGGTSDRSPSQLGEGLVAL